jgi:hypothetical protein
MRHLLTILAALLLCAAPAQAQTMKALMYNTNGVVAYTNTNALTFTNAEVRLSPTVLIGTNFASIAAGGNFISMTDANGDTVFLANTNLVTFYDAIGFNSASNRATTRTNLGLGATWLTNTNVTNFRAAVGLDRIWAYKSTNQTNATTNLVSDSALTFTAAANTKYAVELFLVAKASMTALQGKINSTNATSFGFWVEYDAASQFAWLAGNAVTNRANLVSFDGNDVSVWQRFVIVAPTNNTSVTFQFAPADTNGSAVIEAGSYLKAEVIE